VLRNWFSSVDVIVNRKKIPIQKKSQNLVIGWILKIIKLEIDDTVCQYSCEIGQMEKFN